MPGHVPKALYSCICFILLITYEVSFYKRGNRGQKWLSTFCPRSHAIRKGLMEQIELQLSLQDEQEFASEQSLQAKGAEQWVQRGGNQPGSTESLRWFTGQWRKSTRDKGRWKKTPFSGIGGQVWLWQSKGYSSSKTPSNQYSYSLQGKLNLLRRLLKTSPCTLSLPVRLPTSREILDSLLYLATLKSELGLSSAGYGKPTTTFKQESKILRYN